jgi:hypothetical protein
MPYKDLFPKTKTEWKNKDKNNITTFTALKIEINPFGDGERNIV